MLPFALYDACLGDVIQVAGLSAATPETVTGKPHDAGRFLFRISLVESPVDIRSAASTFVSMGYLVKSYGHVLLAVDAPTSDEAEVLAAHLQVREDAGD